MLILKSPDLSDPIDSGKKIYCIKKFFIPTSLNSRKIIKPKRKERVIRKELMIKK